MRHALALTSVQTAKLVSNIRVLPSPRGCVQDDSVLKETCTDCHAEEFHSTPETQTDEAYNHPEDLEHFAHHEDIERQEAEREAKFQGITVDEALAQHDPLEPPAQSEEQQDEEAPQQEDNSFGGEVPPAQDTENAKQYTDPVQRFRNAKASSADAKPRPSSDRVKCVYRPAPDFLLTILLILLSRKTAPYKVMWPLTLYLPSRER